MSEYTLSKTVAVDCTRGAPCRNVIPIISTLKVDLECEGYNTQPALRPAIHSGDSMQLYEPAPVWDTYPGIGFDITLRDANNVQVETKKKKMDHFEFVLKKKNSSVESAPSSSFPTARSTAGLGLPPLAWIAVTDRTTFQF